MARDKEQKRRKNPAADPDGQELLFEIGTEELPYQFVPMAIAGLRESAERLFKEQRLAHGALRTLGTPRRLVLVVEGLAGRQTPVVKEVMGPSKAVAFDSTGMPTKAGLGFAAAQGLKAEELDVRQTPKGEYVYAMKRDPGREAIAVLGELLPVLIGSLSFPKSMRWNAEGIRFARPIRWLLALFGGEVVPAQFGGLTAGNRTRGHRFLGSGASMAQWLAVKDFKSYVSVLARHGVVPDQEQRRTIILNELADLSTSAHGILHRDDELLEQAIYTVEYPHAILGTFNQQYLEVPKDVLMTAMKEHQGFFSLTADSGALLPAFISVTNMKLPEMQLIREGNERVLAARLADAKFFFDEDRKVTLADRVNKLKGVTFHQKLGTLYQKTERMTTLIDRLADGLADREACRRAARLSKADLLTGLVGEFPTLQGLMGGEYARHDGERAEVSRAVGEHYLPKAMESGLPGTREGQLLSLTDRLDTIVAFFHVGIVPTGSEDPLGLRRHALAIVRLILEGKLTLNLAEAVRYAKDLVTAQGFKEVGTADPLDFLAERLRYYGRMTYGLRDDVMDAVLIPATRTAQETGFDLLDLLARMRALQAMTTRAEFDPLMVGFRRAHRIVEKEKWTRDAIDPARFQHQAETELQKVVSDAQKRIGTALERGDYATALDALVEMKPAIDGFFDGVLVNAEDEVLRSNRLSLLYAVDRIFLNFADFSHIVVQGT
ncbi:MAG TPA: glycine--tRNA ligase subunit beta [Nitrospiraceae bacterium]|nr:glycine--tRNA ligase subunit beta [Nitrospiraceae bacterium]